MTRLYVLYDARCELCRRLKAWLVTEPAWCPIHAVAAGSAQARKQWPDLKDTGELTVIAADGRYWQGNHAWLVALFALKGYRTWARRLAHPLLLPLARQAFAAVSDNRKALGWFLHLQSAEATALYLEQEPVPGCDV
jgi:predicted DCC family thiol-disulfide oxidoreductase YuxK